MAKKNANKIRSEIAAELRRLGEILKTNGVLAQDGVHPFETAAHSCRTNSFDLPKPLKSADRSKLWGYDLSGVIIRLPASGFKNIKPQKTTDISLSYDVCAVGLVENHGELSDPFSALSFQITLTGVNAADQMRRVRNCWHIDRVFDTDTFTTGEIHPVYHYNHGGSNLETGDHDYGDLLQVNVPRFYHPPMDGIIGTDFLLANFLPKAWNQLRDKKSGSNEYRNLLSAAQDRYWRPYTTALQRSFEGFDPQQLDWNPGRIFPQLIPVN